MVTVLKSQKTLLNNTIELLCATSATKENPALIIGVVHGDEPQGKFLIEEYLEKISVQEGLKTDNRIFIPCLNPDGMLLGKRTNSNGVDLNRNFPTENWGVNLGENATCNDASSDYYGGVSPASEIETKFVIDVINEYKPSLILTLHAPYKVVNYDGPAEEIAQEISNIIGYPVEASIGYPTPGSFGTFAGVEKQISTITLELDETCPLENLKQPVFKIFDYMSIG